MRNGLTARGTALVQRMATSQMLQTVRVERITAATYDTTTLHASPGTRTTIYTGVARIWEMSNPGMVQVTNTDFLAYQTVMSIPWDTSGIPHLLDEVEILTSPTDSDWVGDRFRIQTASKGGQIRATRSFVLERLTVRP